MKPRHALLLRFTSFTALIASGPLHAQTWDGGGADNNWNTALNWNPDGNPVNNGTANIIFAGAVDPTPNLNTARQVNSLTFNNTAASFTLQSAEVQSLTIGAGGITQADDSQQNIAHAVVLSAPQTWATTSTGALTVSSNINTGTHALTLSPGANIILEGAISGSGSMVKNGAGYVILSGSSSNTFSGGVTVNSSSLYLQKVGSASAVPGNIIVGDGVGSDFAYLDGSGGGTNQIADSATVTVNSSGNLRLTFSAVETLGTLVVNQGSVSGTLATAETLTANSTQMTGGSISLGDTDNFILGGSLSTNAFASSATISGNLTLGAQRTLTVAEGAAINDLDLTAIVSGSGGFVKAGTGLLRVTGANTFSGGSTLAAGTLAIGGNAVLGTGALTISGGSLIADGAARTLSTPTQLTGNFGFSGANSLTFTGTTIVATAVTADVASGSLTLGTLTGPPGLGILTKAGAGILKLGGATPSDYTGLVQHTAGSLFLDNAGGNATAGPFMITGGTAQALRDHQFPDNSTVAINGGSFLVNGKTETIGELFFDTGAGQLLLLNDNGTDADLTINGDVTTTGASVPTIGSTGILRWTANRIFQIGDNAAAGDLIVAAQLHDAGTGLTKRGAGTVDLAGTVSKTLTGIVRVEEGKIRLGMTSPAKGLQGPLVIGKDIGLAAEVFLTNSSEQLPGGANAVTVRNTGTLSLGALTQTLTSLTVDGGDVTGTGPLIMTGTPQITSPVNAPTTGSIQSPVVINELLSVAASDAPSNVDLEFTGVISGTGSLGLGQSGTVRLSGASTFTGGVTVSAGTLQFGANAGAGTGAVLVSGGSLAAGGAPRTVANPVVLNSGAVNTSDALTLSGPVTVPGVLTKTGNGTLSLSAANSIAGTILLSSGTLNAAAQQTILPGGVFQQTGGTFTGTLCNQGTLLYQGGTFAGTLKNDAVWVLSTAFTAGGGITNNGIVTVNAGGTLSANGTGLTNTGSITLAGGTLGGNGPLVNNSILSGYGTIAGSGGFTNNALVTQSGGNFSLTKTGTNTNAGNIDLEAGRQLILSSSLQNAGTLDLDGAIVTGAGTLNNNAGGAITGRGSITSPFNNAGGLLANTSGTLNITSAFTNAGTLALDGLSAALNGGIITNNGTIQGRGTIGSNLTNSQTIEASGGTLTLGGTITNTGLLTAGIGAKLLISGSMAVNAGTVSLTGGTFDTAGDALNSTGQITGHGTLRTGGLTNNGGMTLTGGLSTVNGNVTNSAGKTLHVAHNPAIFTGNVVNNGIFKNTETTVTFTGNYTENGTFVSDPADNYFTDLLIGTNGKLTGGTGDRFFVLSDFSNASTQNLTWQTQLSELIFQGGTGHDVSLAGADMGATLAGYVNNFAWQTVRLAAGDSLTLSDGNATPGAALYTQQLIIEGGLAQIAAITGNGCILYYNSSDPANVFLNGQTYPLTGGGSITPVTAALTFISSSILPDNSVQLDLLGAPGQLHTLHASTDLVTFTAIGTATADAAGLFSFIDADAATLGRRYYRVTLP